MRLVNLVIEQSSPEEGMKLEAEVDRPLCLFTSAERAEGGGGGSGGGRERAGCSGNAEEKVPSAQDTAIGSIGGPAPAQQLTASHRLQLPGCGCGSSATDSAGTADTKLNGFQVFTNGANPCLKSTSALGESTFCQTGRFNSTTSFDCEHFQFIDDDVDDSETSTTQLNGNTKPNGIGSWTNGVESFPERERNGKHDSDVRHLPESNGETKVEVSGSDYDSQRYDFTQKVPLTFLDKSNAMCECENETKETTTAVQRQVSFDEPGDEGINLRSAPIDVKNTKDLKSVLKKGKALERSGKKGRVTFDEAVTLYSDEFEDVQLLALRSAPEVNCAEVFFMFEPPIEYQDLLPFEPPAEYRDTDDGDTVRDQDDPCYQLPVVEEFRDVNYLEQNGDTSISHLNEERETHDDKVGEKEDIDSGPEPPTDGSDVTVAIETGNTESALHEVDTGREQQIGAAEETEKLFERFLEAEREFAEDEELNRVFHVLEGDFIGDGKNGTFDDNFFKKLINLLSSVEGDVQLEDGDFFSSTDFTVNEEDIGRETEEDEIGQPHSRTLSEADSDCSISSQDTIIVRLGDEETEHVRGKLCRQASDCGLEDIITNDDSVQKVIDELVEVQETCDDVFCEIPKSQNGENNNVGKTPPRPQPRESINRPNSQILKSDKLNSSNGETLIRQSSLEQTQKGTQDPVQDADDSTSSDSRSGEVEEDIRLDDIGYDEEDADDYDEECLRGMAQGNSKIRRIIKKNALQCTLLRGIEARRRQSGAKYPRPKSPLLSQESLVEQLKWLTTVDENKDLDGSSTYNSKPPDVILSTGSVHLNGALPHSTSSEEEINGRSIVHHRLPLLHPSQQRHLFATDNKGVYIVHQSGFPIPQQPRPLRPWIPSTNQHLQMSQHQRSSYPAPHSVIHPVSSPMQHPDDRLADTVTMPRDFRDWRVIQRVMVNRGEGEGNFRYPFPAGFRPTPNGAVNAYTRVIPSDVVRTSNMPGGNDELEQFVQQDIQRIERIRKRYSLAEDDDDPTFGFARRPSVRGVQNQSSNHYQPSDAPAGPAVGTKHIPNYATLPDSGKGPVLMRTRMPPQISEQDMSWGRSSNWRPGDPNSAPLQCPSGGGIRQQAPMHIHRASVALTELPGCATLPHSLSKSHDTRYHSYAENIYGGSQTLPHKRWPTTDPRTCVASCNPTVNHSLVHQVPLMPPPSAVSTPTLQVPPHVLTNVVSDERGVPEGASSSPKVSSDSLYHASMADTIPVGAAHKDDGVIYYSLNV